MTTQTEKTDAVEVAEAPRFIVVRYGKMRTTGLFRVRDEGSLRARTVVVRTERGTELGMPLESSSHTELPSGAKISGEVLRAATERDLARCHRIQTELEAKELAFFKQKVAQYGLAIKPVASEHLLGGERITFYFASEGWADFRALVRELAFEYHTRVEFQRIGARDEAKLAGDCGVCGRPLCCRQFMDRFRPVSVRMAKLQLATLDPSKISGSCGKLMCCLRFEDDIYKELKKRLPKRGRTVLTKYGQGRVTGGDILAQLVRVVCESGEKVTIPLEEIEVVEDAGSKGAAKAGRETQKDASRSPSGGTDASDAAPQGKPASQPESEGPAEAAEGETGAAPEERKEKNAPAGSRRRKRRRRPRRSKKK